MFVRIPIYMFHGVLPEEAPGFDPYSCVTPERLRGLIRTLRRSGIRLLTLDEARIRIESTGGNRETGPGRGQSPGRGQNPGRGRGERATVLTFDDAASPFAEHALPVLEAEGAPATVFIIAGPLDGREPLHLPKESGPPMSPALLRDLERRGIEIGSHGLTHRELAGVAPDELRGEIEGSRALLRKASGAEVTSLCWPRGRSDEAARGAAEAAGYRCACGVRRGSRHAARDRFSLARIRVGMDMTPPRIRWTASGVYDLTRRLRRIGKRTGSGSGA